MATRTPSTLPSQTGLPRILLFGMECPFTLAALEQLIHKHQIMPTAVILPGPPAFDGVLRPRTSLSLTGEDLAPTVTQRAQELGIDVLRAGDLRSQSVQAEIKRLEADLIVVACFDRRIPSRVVDYMRFGGVNIHPSWLPKLRGPDPLFWTLRRGDGSAAVSLHKLAPRFDAGAIIVQSRCAYPDGASEPEVEARLAQLGIGMLVESLDRGGESEHRLMTQNEDDATWAPFPEDTDFELNFNRNARSIFNFVRGLRTRDHRPWFDQAGERFTVIDALEYALDSDPTADSDQPGIVSVGCGRGWVTLQVTNQSQPSDLREDSA